MDWTQEMGAGDEYIQNFGGKTSWKTYSWKPRRRWENTITIDDMESVCEDVSWMEITLERVQSGAEPSSLLPECYIRNGYWIGGGEPRE
jgi:hypothetical protein